MLLQVFIYMFAGALVTFQGGAAEAADRTPVHCETNAPITVLFFGDSLTAARGLAPEQGFAGLIREKVAGFSYPIRVIIAGVSGETTAGGVRRIGWLLRRKIDVMVLALGGNDGLRGIDPQSTRKNLQEIIDLARRSNPRVKLIVAGMEAPPNMGTDYTSSFRRVFKDVAAANDAALIPFLLEGVAAVPELNLPDGIHPNVEGHKIVAKNVWKVLGPLLESMSAGAGHGDDPHKKGTASKKGDDAEILENCKD
jgi:acyl-CoA thioesterase-1